jgi:hypothetical protein
MEKQNKKYYTLGCCGIDCGLCPRYYTKGESKCPGCFGENFAKKHPPCSYITCCVQQHGLEVCGQCTEFSCKKYDDKKVEKDSFVTHKKMMVNQEIIRRKGIEKFIEEQNIRINFLEKILLEYNDKRSKNYFCLAVALLDIKFLNKSLLQAEHKIREENILKNDFKSRAKILKGVFLEYANKKNIDLKLRK